MDILADLLILLHGGEGLVDETPLMHLAVVAIEFEAAERVLDRIERERAEGAATDRTSLSN